MKETLRRTARRLRALAMSLREIDEGPWPPEVVRRLILADRLGLEVDPIDLVDFVEVCVEIDTADLIQSPSIEGELL